MPENDKLSGTEKTGGPPKSEEPVSKQEPMVAEQLSREMRG